MINKVILVGNVGRDPEMQSTPSGQSVAKFSVATSRKWKSRDGERKEETQWHNCVAWGRTAEVIAQYVTKGKQLYVEGRMQTNSWEDRETGKKQYRTEVIVENFQFLGGKSDGSQQRQSSGGGGGGTQSSFGGGRSSNTSNFDNDDVPFAYQQLDVEELLS